MIYNHWSYSNSCKTATQGFFKEVIYAGCLLSSKAKSSIQRPFISKTALSNEWMNEWMNDLFNVEACGKCLHNLPSQRLMLKTLDKLKNTKQDKMWIMHIQVLRKT